MRTGHSLAILIMAVQVVAATDYYVATDGNDANDGRTTNSPFASIQKAADSVAAGGTVFIRGGTYHEDIVIDGLKGTSTNPISFTGYDGEHVLLDGTRSLTDLGSNGWTLHGGNIYKTTLATDIWQLFDDGEMMIMARWPNAFHHDGTIWIQQGNWARGHDANSSNGTMVDNVNNGHDLAASGLDMTGAMGVLNIGSFRSWARPVTNHSAGSNTFTYNPVPASAYRTKLGYYYLECKLNLLDAEREWFYDPSSKTLYLWAPGGAVPSGDLRGKVQTYAFNITNGDYVVLDGLNFFGTTFNMTGTRNSTVQNCNLQFPSFSKRMLGSEADIEFANMQAGNSHPGNTLRNCVFEYSDGQAVRMSGAGSVMENNYFHEIDFSCAGLPNLGNTVQVELGSVGAIIRHNTIDTAGASETIAPGKEAIVEFNRVTKIGLLQSDGAGVHRMVPEAPGSITRYNWFHDHDKYSIRFDGDPAGTNGLVHHNVVWNSDTMRLKGNHHQVYNNFGFGGLFNKGIINIATDKGGNANSVTRNNAADDISPATVFSSGDPLPGIESHNWNGSWKGTDVRDQVRNAAFWDFRPRAGSELIDAGTNILGITDGYLGNAPDIGAYEFGASDYWIAGRKWPQASTPIPPNQATNVQADADLMWLEGYQSETNAIYLGSSSSNLVFQGIQTNNIFDPGALSAGTNLYWRVDSIGAVGTVTGEVWSFTVAGSPATGDLLFSQHTNAPLDHAVTWFLASSNVWNSITTNNNDGVGNEKMYGQTFSSAKDFLLSAISFHATSDTKSYGEDQTLELALMVDTDTNDVPDTLVGEVMSVGFPSIDGSRPWKQLKLLEPVPMAGGKTYGFVYTLVGPISDNLRVANSKTGGYADGKAINTDYPFSSFPGSLPPALNDARDIAFTVQQVPAIELYAAWAGEYDLAGEDGYLDNPDGDQLDNLAEYGFGGAPDDYNNEPLPTLEGLTYVYRRRTDASVRGLNYMLEECTNLLSNDWNEVTVAPEGIAPLEEGFEAVKNQFFASESNRFIRLRILID